MRRVGVCEELGDDTRLSNDFIGDGPIGEFDGRNKSTLRILLVMALVLKPLKDQNSIDEAYRVHLQIPRLPRLIQINNNFFIRKAQFPDHDMRPVRPRAAMISVQGNLWRSHCASVSFSMSFLPSVEPLLWLQNVRESGNNGAMAKCPGGMRGESDGTGGKRPRTRMNSSAGVNSGWIYIWRRGEIIVTVSRCLEIKGLRQSSAYRILHVFWPTDHTMRLLPRIRARFAIRTKNWGSIGDPHR